MFARLSPLQRSLISAAAGFLAYGSWSFWVNAMHGMGIGLKAGLVQGSYSFVLTLVMTLMIEKVYRCFTQTGKARQALIFTPVIICLILYSSSWTINVLAGTPEIFNTVLPGYIIGTLYTLAYTGKLASLTF